MDEQELKGLREQTIKDTTDETTWGGPAGDILTGIHNAENAPAERAIWELVQNARDVSWEDEPAVISFKRTVNGLSFSHRGKPFTNTSLESLIKQTSSKVRSDIKTVGKYGTGFLVTHKFGRIITLSGKLQVVDGYDLYYPFRNFEMDRSSEDKNTLKDSLKSQASKVNKWGFDPLMLTNDSKGETVFEYKTQNEAQRLALEQAFSGAPSHAPYVLALNSRYIQEISFADEMTSTHISFRLCKAVEFIEEGETYQLTRTVIDVSGEPNPLALYCLVSKRTDYRIDEGVVTVILPVSEQEGRYKAMLYPVGMAKLFLSLPLIGTDNWGVNYVVHSPLFECENDSRSGLRIVPQGLGLPDNDNRDMLDVAFGMVKEWLEKSFDIIDGRMYLGRVNFDRTVPNPTSLKFNEEQQCKWTDFFKDLPLARNEQQQYILSKDLHVLDESLLNDAKQDDNLKKALHDVISLSHPDATPFIDDFLYWSETIRVWACPELADHIHGIDSIVESIVRLDLNADDKSISEEWKERLHVIVEYIIRTENEGLLGKAIIPNEAGFLHNVKEIYKLDAFTPEFRSVIDDIVPAEKDKFIHPSFSNLSISNLGKYTELDAKKAITSKLTELQDAVTARLREISVEVKADTFNPSDEKWKEIIDDVVLQAVLRLFSMRIADRDADNLEAKLCRQFAKYMNVTEYPGASLTNEFFTDVEQMWRTILFETIYRYERLPQDKQKEMREWLKELIIILKDYKATEDYLKRFVLYPDQAGRLRMAEDLADGRELLPEMKAYYDTIVASEGETIKSFLADDVFAEYLPHNAVWDNAVIGGRIEDVVCKIEGFPNIHNYAKKAEVLQIVKRFNVDTPDGQKWISYFKALSAQKTAILVSFTESESVFKLLLQPEHRLKTMSELASQENVDELLRLAKKEWEKKMYEDADMQYKRILGLYVEDYLVSQLKTLLNENEEIRALPGNETVTGEDKQGGQDIIVYVEKNGIKSQPLYYLEIKSRWSTRESVEMSKLQMVVSAEKHDCYALCVVDMHDFDKEKVFKKEYPQEFGEIKDRISVVTVIGNRNARLVPYAQDSKTDVHLGGDIKSVVPQDFVKDNHIEFDELMEIIVKRVKGFLD